MKSDEDGNFRSSGLPLRLLGVQESKRSLIDIAGVQFAHASVMTRGAYTLLARTAGHGAVQMEGSRMNVRTINGEIGKPGEPD
jgi:hypothetical protein